MQLFFHRHLSRPFGSGATFSCFRSSLNYFSSFEILLKKRDFSASHSVYASIARVLCCEKSIRNSIFSGESLNEWSAKSVELYNCSPEEGLNYRKRGGVKSNYCRAGLLEWRRAFPSLPIRSSPEKKIRSHSSWRDFASRAQGSILCEEPELFGPFGVLIKDVLAIKMKCVKWDKLVHFHP